MISNKTEWRFPYTGQVMDFNPDYSTGIRCEMNPDYALFIMPRSGLGFKYQIFLSNTLALIDSDFAYSDNEGHIMIKLLNNGKKDLCIKEGDKFCQGVFLPYGITIDDDVNDKRNGGLGSTGL